MGLSGIGIPSVILILIVVILIFGTKKLRNAGSDLGSAVKNFRRSMQQDDLQDQDNNEKLNSKNLNSERMDEIDNETLEVFSKKHKNNDKKIK